MRQRYLPRQKTPGSKIHLQRKSKDNITGDFKELYKNQGYMKLSCVISWTTPVILLLKNMYLCRAKISLLV